MVKKIILVIGCFIYMNSAIAGQCDSYKKNPELNIKKSSWEIHVNNSEGDLWPKAGYVQISPFSSFQPKIGYAFNGKYFCVFLDSMDVEAGFNDFEIFIDKKYEKDTCEYNAVLEHENHHISDAVAALDNLFDNLEPVLQDVINNIEPIYVENVDDVPQAFDKISDQIVNNKKLRDLDKNFKEQNSRDASVLDNGPDEKLKKCTEDKVNAAFEKYFKNKKDK